MLRSKRKPVSKQRTKLRGLRSPRSGRREIDLSGSRSFSGPITFVLLEHAPAEGKSTRSFWARRLRTTTRLRPQTHGGKRSARRAQRSLPLRQRQEVQEMLRSPTYRLKPVLRALAFEAVAGAVDGKDDGGGFGVELDPLAQLGDVLVQRAA